MANLSEIKKYSNWGDTASTLNSNFQNVNVDLEKVKNSTINNKGYFSNPEKLNEAYPSESSRVGMIAYVGTASPYAIYQYTESGWTDTGETYTPEVNLGDYYSKSEVDRMTQQQDDKIVDLEEKVEAQKVKVDTELSESSENPIANSVVAGKITELEQKINSQTVEVDTELNEESQKPIANAPVTKGINKLKEQISTQLPAIEEAKENAIAEIGNKESDAIQNFSEQRVTPGMLSPETIQIINASGGGTINNLPDGETLAEIEMAEGLKAIGIPNRQPDTNLGYVILKKNKSLIEQITEANTIYEVRYAYDLGGETLSMPENCVLKFEGGVILNGTLTGNNTIISSEPYYIFEEIEFGGSWNVQYIYAEWFGAKPVPTSSKSSDNADALWMGVWTNTDVETYKDCSNGINQALLFSSKFGGSVKALGRCVYKLDNTVYIPCEAEYITEEGTIFCPVMQGSGNKIITHNEDDYSFLEQNLESPVESMYPNQFIATDAMAVAFQVEPAKTKFVGKGTITLVMSRYTIGILIKHRTYEYLDMSTGLTIDIRTIGANSNNGHDFGIDMRDLKGDEDPTDETLNEEGRTIYYWNRTTKYRWKKANKATTWSKDKIVDNLFNTTLRFDVGGTAGKDGRIIDPKIHINDMYGYRGMEIYTHDKGWFNISKMEGTMSNKHGGVFFVYTNYDVGSHDWTGITSQVGNIQYDYRLLQVIKGSGIKVGGGSDLAYSNPDIEYAFYLGKGTSNCSIGFVESLRYVYDAGTNNNYDYNININDNQSLLGTSWINLLDGKTPKKANLCIKPNSVKVINEPIDESDIANYLGPKLQYSGEDINVKYLYDSDPTTSENLIDTENNIYGTSILITNGDRDNPVQTTLSNAWIEINYLIKGTDINKDTYKNDIKVYWGETRLYRATNLNKTLPFSYASTYAGAISYIGKVYLPLGRDKIDCRVLFLTNNQEQKLILEVFSIKVWVNSYDTSNYAKNQDLWLDKDCIKKYGIVKRNNSIFMNLGDAKSEDLVKVSFEKKVINHGTNDTTITINSEELHVWDAVDSLNITLSNPNSYEEYMFEFKSGENPTDLVVNGVKWISTPSDIIEANKTYQVSVINKIGIIGGV